MSKFDDLCKAYQIAKTDYSQYHEACLKFYGWLLEEFVKYLGCPKEQVALVPLDKDPEPDTIYSLAGAMHLNDDTFWHLGVRLTLYIAPNTFPRQPVLLRLLAKKEDDHFVLKLGNFATEYKVRNGNQKDLEPVFDFLFAQTKEHFEKGLQRFLSQGDQTAPTRKIGF